MEKLKPSFLKQAEYRNFTNPIVRFTYPTIEVATISENTDYQAGNLAYWGVLIAFIVLGVLSCFISNGKLGDIPNINYEQMNSGFQTAELSDAKML